MVGILSREHRKNKLNFFAVPADRLHIFVENLGRINFNVMNDFKGIRGAVVYNGIPLNMWTITGFPFISHSDILNAIELQTGNGTHLEDHISNQDILKASPTVFHGAFEITSDSNILDTYLDPTGWGKVMLCDAIE